MRTHFELFGCGTRIMMVFVLFSLGIYNSMAQEEREYVPFVEEGKVWYCSYSSLGPITLEHPEGEGIDCTFSMCGDTLVNDREYKKVYCQFEDYYGDKEQHYYCAVREETYQVFIIEEEETEEKLIYDFSCPGEFVMLNYNDFQFVRTEGWHQYGFLPGQLKYSVCQFTDDGEVDYCNSPSYWADGIGTYLNNPFAFELRFLPFEEPKLGKDIHLVTCMKDEKYYFNIEWTYVPGDQSSINKGCYTDNSTIESRLYDLQGRQLRHAPTKGVYIQDGKKWVVK